MIDCERPPLQVFFSSLQVIVGIVIMYFSETRVVKERGGAEFIPDK